MATGTGYLALAAASLGHRVTAVDLASTMLDELVAGTTGTRDQLPLMHLDTPEPILDMLAEAGFVDRAAEPRPDLDLGAGLPYLITASTPRPGG